ncbi:hypothetical protein [Brevibacterium yomogidense]|uniref:hypothetical protein n=1 Tax=Brevibacterium yomogidense TaxID=946573 RepID=UPI0018E0491B|nr:hypothetical protein [Brevibacterium yomogidense]
MTIIVPFTFDYASEPFGDRLEAPEVSEQWRAAMQPEVLERAHAWAESMLVQFDETTGLFGSEETRAASDREYVAILAELIEHAPPGIEFRPDMWW